MHRYTPALLVLLPLLTATTVRATPLPRYGIFVYGSMCIEKESGDPAGRRLTLMRYGDGDHVLFQWSEGPACQAVGAKVAIDRTGSHISFRGAFPSPEPPFKQSHTGENPTQPVTLSGGHTRAGPTVSLSHFPNVPPPKLSCPVPTG